jgi:ankyrin repeat protein
MIKAAKNDELAMLEMLKENPGLVNQKDFISGYTALHWAAKNGNIKLAEVLVGKYFAGINEKTHGGYTALHLAAQHGHQDLFDKLIDKFDADFTIRDNYGRKPHQYKHVLRNQRMGRKPGFRNSELKIFSYYTQSVSLKTL